MIIRRKLPVRLARATRRLFIYFISDLTQAAFVSLAEDQQATAVVSTAGYPSGRTYSLVTPMVASVISSFYSTHVVLAIWPSALDGSKRLSVTSLRSTTVQSYQVPNGRLCL